MVVAVCKVRKFPAEIFALDVLDERTDRRITRRSVARNAAICIHQDRRRCPFGLHQISEISCFFDNQVLRKLITELVGVVTQFAAAHKNKSNLARKFLLPLLKFRDERLTRRARRADEHEQDRNTFGTNIGQRRRTAR